MSMRRPSVVRYEWPSSVLHWCAFFDRLAVQLLFSIRFMCLKVGSVGIFKNLRQVTDTDRLQRRR